MRWVIGLVLVATACRQPAPPTTPSGSAPAGAREPPKPRGRIVVSDTSIEILPVIKFDGLTSNVVPEAIKTLDAIVATLDGNPSILLVEVTAFGSDGDPRYQQVIGDQRARAIVDYLVKHGVARARLRSRGMPQPPAGQDSRPVFAILQRAD